MFVRFIRDGRRLVANLVHNRRVDGRVVSEHIARLGSCLLPSRFPRPSEFASGTRCRTAGAIHG